jgi:hypothetical protein
LQQIPVPGLKKGDRKTGACLASKVRSLLKFNVAWFGPVVFGHVMGWQIIKEVNDSGDFFEGWTPLESN